MANELTRDHDGSIAGKELSETVIVRQGTACTIEFSEHTIRVLNLSGLQVSSTGPSTCVPPTYCHPAHFGSPHW